MLLSGKKTTPLLLAIVLVLGMGCRTEGEHSQAQPPASEGDVEIESAVPVWARDTLFHRLVPERLRSEHEALRRGRFEVLYTNEAQELYAFSRTHEGAAFVVVLNRSGEAKSLRVPLPEALRGGIYELVFLTPEGAAHRVQQDPTGLVLALPARGAMVLREGE